MYEGRAQEGEREGITGLQRKGGRSVWRGRLETSNLGLHIPSRTAILMPPFPDTLPPCSRPPHKLVSAHPTPTLFGRHYPSDRPPASRQTLFLQTATFPTTHQLTIHSYRTLTHTLSFSLSLSLTHLPTHTLSARFASTAGKTVCGWCTVAMYTM